MKRKVFYCVAAFLLAAVLGLSACGAGAKRSSTTAMATAAYEGIPQEAGAGAMNDEAMMEVTAEKADLSDTTSVSMPVPAGRKLIRNVNLSVETDEFDQLLKTLTARVGELGGYIEQSDISGNSLNHQNERIARYATLTVRVPISQLDGFVATVETSGNVTGKSENTQDVTLQYSDLESRKKSLTVEQDRIWALLEKADTLESVIVLEERLSEIRYQLESMESQLRLYDNQVDYSTVYLHINEIIDATGFTPTEPLGINQRISSGFSKNLTAVSHGLTGLFIGLVTSSPFWLPLALVIGGAWFITQSRKRKKRKADEQMKRKDAGPAGGDGNADQR